MEQNTAQAANTGDTTSHRRKHCALLISLVMPCLAYVSIVLLTGDRLFPLSQMAPGREYRAALAIRDNVIPFFKWGTLLFTRRYLQKYYDESWYFTQAARDDGKEAFIAVLEEALETHPVVDLFLLAHSNNYIKWVQPLPEDLRRRIRFVYNTGCRNKGQSDAWLALGADTYIGHPGESQSPFFYFFLLRHWTRGESLGKALEIGNRGMEAKFRLLDWASGGRYTAEEAMKESKASCTGNTGLRLGDLP